MAVRSKLPGVTPDLIRGTNEENMPPPARFDAAHRRRLERAAVHPRLCQSAPSLFCPLRALACEAFGAGFFGPPSVPGLTRDLFAGLPGFVAGGPGYLLAQIPG